jgi:hypothetical protein
MAFGTIGTGVTIQTYLKFVECCSGTEILFSGSLAITNGLVYSYVGTVPFTGSGGSLEPGRCYTITTVTSSGVITYPAVPPIAVIAIRTGCDDKDCFNCNPANPCDCPEGYVIVDDFCVGIETVDPIPPKTIVFTGNIVDGGGGLGLLTFQSLNNFVWPLFTTPQLLGDIAAMTIIPNTGNNPVTGDSWTALNPLPQTGINAGKHQPITTATPGGFPALPSPPNPPASFPLRPLRESTITGTTLNYGGGNPIGYDNYEPSTSPWNTWYTDVAVWSLPGLSVINQYAGFLVCLEPTVETVYQVIMTGNNGVRLFVDDYLAVEMLNGDGNFQALAYNNHFQITLSPGLHILRLECYNYTGGGGLAAEVLECSAATVYGFTSLADFIPYRKFSTLWKKSRNLQITATGSNVITLTSGTTLSTDVSGFIVQTSGTGFPANTFVTSVINSTTFTVNNNVPNGVYNSCRIQFAYDVSSIANNSFSCPEGYTLTTCDGIACVRTVELPCSSNCYLVIPCDGADTFVTNNFEFEDYINQFATVETDDFTGCAYIIKLEDNDCEDSIKADIYPDIECTCDLRCFYISRSKGFLYVDSNDELQEVSQSNASPYIKVCSKIYPVLINDDKTSLIEELGSCEDDECPQQCYKLVDCNDDTNFFFSNSDSLLPYVYGTNNIVNVIGKDGCWEVTESIGNCDCITVTIEAEERGGLISVTEYTALNIGTYNNGWGVWKFTIEGDDFFIWNNNINPSTHWYISSTDCCAAPGVTYAKSKVNGRCPETITDGTLTGWVIGGGNNWISVQTEICPAECDCPIDVTVTSSYEKCEDCLPVIAYKLTSCVGSDVIYTLNDLEEYIGLVVKINCGCYKVELITQLPPNPQTVIVEDVYTFCIECTREYWKLEDCAGDRDPIITYTNVDIYVGKVIKIENCSECWIVTPTDEHIGASTVVVTNEYDDCPECLIPTICECTKITNLNEVEKTYTYYDCDNVLQSITLEPGESSDKVCALYWITEPLFCSCIQFKLNGQSYYAFIIPGKLFNGKPVYNLCTSGDTFDCGYVYWDGSNWVISDNEDNPPTWILPISTSESCPYGDWEEYNQEVGPNPIGEKTKAAAVSTLTSQPCDLDICTCITFTTNLGDTTTFYVVAIDEDGYPIYSDGVSTIQFSLKSNCWVLNLNEFEGLDGFGEFYLLCDAGEDCPIGNWETEKGQVIAGVSVECPPVSVDFTYLDHFETFGECKFGNCPQPVFKNNRTVRPGYNTPNCNPAEYDKITCKFADVMYKVVLEKRYGITNCCPDEDEKWLLKKELIDLQALRDPNYKCEACGCPCKSGKSYSSCNCGN